MPSVLSANGDTKLVMKGITHGACDYLLKPIRIEELQNIWQHVVRRKKFDRKDRYNSGSQDKARIDNGEATGIVNVDQNEKLNKKRKDQNEDEDEERDENGHDNEDPSTQKKPRVVWSVELHHKFVAAVKQMGIDSMFSTSELWLDRWHNYYYYCFVDSYVYPSVLICNNSYYYYCFSYYQRIF